MLSPCIRVVFYGALAPFELGQFGAFWDVLGIIGANFGAISSGVDEVFQIPFVYLDASRYSRAFELSRADEIAGSVITATQPFSNFVEEK